jgi:hypothetical protein
MGARSASVMAPQPAREMVMDRLIKQEGAKPVDSTPGKEGAMLRRVECRGRAGPNVDLPLRLHSLRQ